jgi:aryl-alcohol dehydrogenase-like predicted oxidoreductase
LDEKAVQRVVDSALDKGINFFDTSNVYAQGLSEEFLGKAVKGRRSGVVIATKFGRRVSAKPRSWNNFKYSSSDIPEGSNPNDGGCSRYHIMQAVDESLRRLQTDHIDLYQLHNPDPSTPIEETLRTLDDLVRMGKVRYIGCSNFSAYQLCQAMETSKRLNLEAFISAQERYSVMGRRIEAELVPCYEHYGLGLIPYRPLRGGFLAGRFRRGQGIPSDSPFVAGPRSITPEEKERLLSDRSFDILEKLESFTKERNHTVGELALAWLTSHPVVSSIIVGSETPSEIDGNLKGTEWKLSTEDFAEINRIGRG